MSTINKILKTAALIGFVDGGLASMATYKENFEGFNQSLVYSAIFITLPALLGVGMDRVINQNITSNKIIQYGLTAVETYGIASNLHDDNSFFITLIICKSLALKNIWDSSDEPTPELNTEFDQQTNLIEIV